MSIAAPDHTVQQLRAIEQDHLLAFYDQLSSGEQQHLLEQIEAIDLPSIPKLVETYVKRRPETHIPEDLSPAAYYPADHRAPGREWDRQGYADAGERLLREGKVAAFCVAGGQGSRLGYDGPKGCYPAGPITRKPLFQIFAEGIINARATYNADIPWYILVSELNEQQTRAFFEEHGYFGLPKGSVFFAVQGTMPSFDAQTGRILLKSRHEIATNPDGHGGAIRALHTSGALDDMRARGVEHLSYFQVDNPAVNVLDKVFIGLHAGAPDSSAQMSSKMVAKAYPEEKVGVFCRADGKTVVIEYSDMPRALAEATNPDGSLRFNAGSVAIHMLGVDFIEQVATNPAFSLPFHRADKKVAHLDPESGEMVEPQSPNAVKLEMFVFDALALCDRSIVLETSRAEEFAPIKNATGVDSAESSRALLIDRAARWLESAGVTVPRRTDGVPDCRLEISPRLAVSPEQLGRAGLPGSIDAGASVVLGDD